MADRGIDTRIVGSAGGTLLDPWPGNPRWIDEVRPQIDSWNPDVVIVQSTLFPGATDPARQQAYIAAARELFGVAGSRGAHVYVVGHNDPPAAKERNERDIAQYIQALVAGPGVSRIPVDWWLARCTAPYSLRRMAPERVGPGVPLDGDLGGDRPAARRHRLTSARRRRRAMVRTGGFEPPRPVGHWDLNPARLPVPPRPHGPRQA